MSEVTNVVILASVCNSDGPEIAAVNAELKRLGVTSGEFVEVSDYAGGKKAMECSVYLAAFNFVIVENVLDAIRSAPWCRREQVQVFVREEGEEIFRLMIGEIEIGPCCEPL